MAKNVGKVEVRKVGDVGVTEYGDRYRIIEVFKIGKNGTRYRIEFLKNKNTKVINTAQAKSGLIPNRFNQQKIVIGAIRKSNNHGKFKIIEKVKPNNYKCRFIETGYETTTRNSSINAGMVVDRLKKTVCGVGCIGDYKSSKYKGLYIVWHNMIARCYDPNDISYKNYGGKGVRVHNEWLNFTNFVDTIHLVKGWDKKRFDNGEIQLDKDISDGDSKIYSIEKCTFVTPAQNIQYKDSVVEFNIIFLDGSTYKYRNMERLERLFPITAVNVGRCVSGKQSHYKGLVFQKNKGLAATNEDIKRADKKLKMHFDIGYKRKFKIILPNNSEFYHCNLRELSDNTELRFSNVVRCLSEERLTHKGLKFKLLPPHTNISKKQIINTEEAIKDFFDRGDC